MIISVSVWSLYLVLGRHLIMYSNVVVNYLSFYSLLVDRSHRYVVPPNSGTNFKIFASAGCQTENIGPFARESRRSLEDSTI
jgi:hypothetical protein